MDPKQMMQSIPVRSELEGVTSARLPAVAFQNVVGSSPVLRRAIALGCRVAQHVGTTVLIQGETGTGKELFARGIHYSSPNAAEPFVAINCSAIPEHLLESELFGHERGSFSGAVSQKKGLFEFADTGTVFLDEVGDLPASMQPKLLRVLEEKKARRVGGLKEIDVRCRIIAATNSDMLVAVAERRFRADLFYRLSAFAIELPALRQRTGDIEVLARYFCDQLATDHGPRVRRLSADALDALRAYHWPGNVRELKNVIEGALIVCDGEWIRSEHLRIGRRRSDAAASEVTASGISIPPGGVPLHDVERQLVEATFRLAGRNISRSARMLGISRPTMLRKLDKYGLRGRGTDEAIV